jgi:hypothetical protein
MVVRVVCAHGNEAADRQGELGLCRRRSEDETTAGRMMVVGDEEGNRPVSARTRRIPRLKGTRNIGAFACASHVRGWDRQTTLTQPFNAPNRVHPTYPSQRPLGRREWSFQC